MTQDTPLARENSRMLDGDPAARAGSTETQRGSADASDSAPRPSHSAISPDDVAVLVERLNNSKRLLHAQGDQGHAEAVALALTALSQLQAERNDNQEAFEDAEALNTQHYDLWQAARAAIDEKDAEIARLREALKPFANATLLTEIPSEGPVCVSITHSDFQRARAALSPSDHG